MAREKLLTVRASERAMARLKAVAALQGETKSEFVRKAISERIRVVESSIEFVPPPAPVGEAKPCRHGLVDCRTCRTGRYA